MSMEYPDWRIVPIKSLSGEWFINGQHADPKDVERLHHRYPRLYSEELVAAVTEDNAHVFPPAEAPGIISPVIELIFVPELDEVEPYANVA